MYKTRTPGPIGSSRLEPDWIKHGMLSRSQRYIRHCPLPLVVAVQKDKDLEFTKAMIDIDIKLITESSFGKTKKGKQIVKLLHKLNKNGQIVYGDGEWRYGSWDGKTLRVTEDFHGKAYRTIPVLVHEASHALWEASHALWKKDAVRKTPEEVLKNAVADELQAQKNQLAIYKALKEEKNIPEDPELERRLKREANHKLKQYIEQRLRHYE